MRDSTTRQSKWLKLLTLRGLHWVSQHPPQGTVSHVVGAALVIAIVDNAYKGTYDIDNGIISLDYSDSVMWRHRLLQAKEGRRSHRGRYMSGRTVRT